MRYWKYIYSEPCVDILVTDDDITLYCWLILQGKRTEYDKLEKGSYTLVTRAQACTLVQFQEYVKSCFTEITKKEMVIKLL